MINLIQINTTASKTDYMSRFFLMYDKFAYCAKCGSENAKFGWKPKELRLCPDCGEWLRHKPRVRREAYLAVVPRY